MTGTLRVDTDIPAGNGIIERVGNDQVWFRPDIRDTTEFWFYWHIRVRGAAGRTIRFHLTEENALTSRGPAVSLDQGLSWERLSGLSCEGWSFAYKVPAGADDIRLSMGMPYTNRDLSRFHERHGHSPRLKTDRLCLSRKGREVPLWRIGNPAVAATTGLVMTARHHCCEMMAGYAMEGVVESMLGDGEVGRFFADNVQAVVIPMVDYDGVEDGDQGKFRGPHDHGADYGSESIYPETRAIRSLVSELFGVQPFAWIDLHCPWIRGEDWNEHLYIVGSRDPEVWKQQCALGEILERTKQGPIPYTAAGNLPFGTAWNVARTPETGDRKPPTRWAYEQPTCILAGTFELPYAVAGGVEVNADSAREFGRDLARALSVYLGTK